MALPLVRSTGIPLAAGAPVRRLGRPTMDRTKPTPPGRLAAALVLGALAACGRAPAKPLPTVILVSLDTVRADNLSCYGGPAGATPNLDAFAAGADRYGTARSTSPWTLPSHASLFTGLYPFEHGAQSFLPGEGHRGDNVFALAPRIETLAEALGARGYATAGIVSNSVYLRPGLGLEQGFDTWDVRREEGHAVTDRALAWLARTQDTGRPRFLFVNYMDAHRPYATGDPEDRCNERLDALVERVMVGGEEPGELGDEVRALHQKAVARLDQHVGRLLHDMRAMGVFEDALVIVTSDHGEAFGAHGVVEHSKDVYEDLVRVPLLVKAPGQELGTVVEAAASGVDVAGLVAEVLERAGAQELTPLFPRRPGQHPLVAENSYSRLLDLARYGDRFHRMRRAVYDGPLKLVIDSRGEHELYDLAQDPGETRDLAPERPGEVARLVAADAAFAGPRRFQGERVLPANLSSAQVREMGVLGYGGDGK